MKIYHELFLGEGLPKDIFHVDSTSKTSQCQDNFVKQIFLRKRDIVSWFIVRKDCPLNIARQGSSRLA